MNVAAKSFSNIQTHTESGVAVNDSYVIPQGWLVLLIDGTDAPLDLQINNGGWRNVYNYSDEQLDTTAVGAYSLYVGILSDGTNLRIKNTSANPCDIKVTYLEYR